MSGSQVRIIRFSLALSLCAAGACLGAFGLSARPDGKISKQFSPSHRHTAPTIGHRSMIRRASDLAEPPNIELYGVTCVASSDCWAVGYRATAISRTLIEHWDGTSWKFVSSPNTDPSQSNLLAAVTCVSTSDCWAVGGYYDNSFVEHTLTEHWNGSAWSIVTSPNMTGANLLAGVNCASSSDCWAVGHGAAFRSPQDDAGFTLTEHWDGAAWTIVTSPNVGSTELNTLAGVACISGSDCWAAGSYHIQSNEYRTLIQHWNGTSWTIVPSPNLDLAENVLNSIACTSSSQCWAVGYFNDTGGYSSLLERWDGSSWTYAEPPTLLQNDVAQAVACTSASDCWAVGIEGEASALFQHWNGSAWSSAASPNADQSTNASIYGVACASASDCWAVGSLNQYAGLIDHWNGTSWTVQPVAPILAIKSVMRVASGHIAIDGQGPANISIEIDAGTDLNGNFDPIGTVTSDATGAFHLEDTDADTFPARFYWGFLP